MKWIPIVAALLASVSPASSDLLLLGVGGQAGGGVGTSYVGPGDVVAGATYFGSCQFAYSAAVAVSGTSKSCNLRRASDNHTCDVLLGSAGSWTNTTGCSTGSENGTAVATWCNATTCSVTKAYDQTGNGNDLSQATAAQQPTIIFNGVGSNAVLSFSAASNQFLTLAVLNTTINLPSAVTSVLKFTGAAQAAVGSQVGGAPQFGNAVGSAANTLFMFNNAVFNVTGTDNVYHTLAMFFPSAGATNCIMNLDGVDNSGVCSNNSVTVTSLLWGADALTANHPWQGTSGEFGWWTSLTPSGTQRTNLCHNMFVRWGTPVSC
jgi:hypothetical protein